MTTFVELIHNAAMLLALVLLYDTIPLKRQRGKIWIQALNGVVIGTIGVALMTTPWHLMSGIVFDTRSILLSLSGLFFGLVPTAIAMVLTVLYRLYIGGIGAWTGATVIVTSGALGLAWRQLRRHRLQQSSALELFLFGVVVHVCMLLWMLSLPWPFATQVLATISLPVMAIYPASTILVGKLLANQLTRKQIQDALRESESRWRALAESSPDHILTLDTQLNIEFANYASPGLTVRELIGTPLYTYVEPDMQPRVKATLEGVLQTGKPSSYETTYNAPDRTIYYESRVMPRIVGGQIAGLTLTARDVTAHKEADIQLKEYSGRLEEMVEVRTQELQRAQEQLVRREKLAMLGQLAGSVGHELRNPLGVISNTVYLLKAILPHPSEAAQEYLEMIAQEVQTATQIVVDLLDFARTRDPEKQSCEVTGLVDQVLSEQLPPNTVHVETDMPADLPLVLVDPRQIDLVLANLVLNAYQAMPQGGTLSIAARQERDMVAISIADTGHGILPEHVDRLFEPLFTTKARGIGLGLAIARNLTEASGGTIEVASEPDEGATFTVWLPICRLPPPSVQACLPAG